MVAFKAYEASRALAKPDPRWRVWLIYGPDAGLVSERVGQIVKMALGKVVDDEPADPFRFVLLDGDEAAADPLRLLDEANTIGLFGGDKVIRVSRTAKMLNAAVEPVLASPPGGAVIVIEAGDLTPKNPLRVSCERSANAVALPCYADDGKTLAELVDSTLRHASISIDRGARDVLLASLGSDRLVSRQELNKLMVYLGDAKRVELADIEACTGDSSVRESDTLVDACFSGQSALADSAFARLRSEGLEPSVVTGALLRHALMLLQARIKIESGQSAQDVSASLRLPFPRKPAAQTMLTHWTAQMLMTSITALGQSVAEARKNALLSAEISQRAMLAIGQRATRLNK